MLIISHSEDWMTAPYKQVTGQVDSRTEEGWLGPAFLFQRTKYLWGELRLTYFELLYIREVSKSHDRCVSKMLCLLRRDKGSLLGSFRAWSGPCGRLTARGTVVLGPEAGFGHGAVLPAWVWGAALSFTMHLTPFFSHTHMSYLHCPCKCWSRTGAVGW